MSAGDRSPAALRRALREHVLATNRHRARVARSLRLHDSELAALDHVAARGSLTPRELRDLLGLSSGGVTMLGQRLERLGYLERRPHPRDRRSHVVKLTPLATERLAAHLGPVDEELDAALGGLAADERARLTAVLGQATAIVERAAAGARGSAVRAPA
jgi:DNA-binding MarR family transcriptional regulator